MTTPRIPPSLLPGRSARDWWVVTLKSLVVAAIGFGLAWVSSLILLGWLHWVVGGVAIVCMFGSSVGVAVSTAQGYRASRREREAGYTTTGYVDPELWQLHWKTGAVIEKPRSMRERPPGSEPP